MSLVMRLQRYGNKNRPFFHVVVADRRFPRNGRFIEKLGYYDPTVEPSTIELKPDRMAHWYKLGARPSDTVNTLLKAKKVDLTKV